MDEKQTNEAKQFMIVHQADSGRIRTVTGMNSVGNLHTVEPTQQNVSNLLIVNTQDTALETFFKKFMQEVENPPHTGIFIMAENALDKLIRIDFDPEILENYRINLASQTQEQRFEPLDTSKIDLEKKGIRMEDLEPHLRAMSYGHKSNGLVDMNPELRVATKGRVSLEEQPGGPQSHSPLLAGEAEPRRPLPRRAARQGGEEQPHERLSCRQGTRPRTGAGEADPWLCLAREVDEYAGVVVI